MRAYRRPIQNAFKYVYTFNWFTFLFSPFDVAIERSRSENSRENNNHNNRDRPRGPSARPIIIGKILMTDFIFLRTHACARVRLFIIIIIIIIFFNLLCTASRFEPRVRRPWPSSQRWRNDPEKRICTRAPTRVRAAATHIYTAGHVRTAKRSNRHGDRMYDIWIQCLSTLLSAFDFRGTATIWYEGRQTVFSFAAIVRCVDTLIFRMRYTFHDVWRRNDWNPVDPVGAGWVLIFDARYER